MPESYAESYEQLCRCALLRQREVYLESAKAQYIDILGEYDIRWCEIRGISDFAADYEPERYAQVMERVLCGVAAAQLSTWERRFLLLRLYGDDAGVHVAMGSDAGAADVLIRALRAAYPGAEVHESEFNMPNDLREGGVLTGYPSFIGGERNVADDMPLDLLIRAMGNHPFCVTIAARLEPPERTNVTLNAVLQRQQRVTSDISRHAEMVAGISEEFKNFFAERYAQSLEKLSQMLSAAQRSSLWETEIFYAAQTGEEASRLGALLCASFNADTQAVLEPMVCRRMICRPGSEYAAMAAGLLSGSLFLSGPSSYSVNQNAFSTLCGARELAQLMALPRRECSGYYVNQFVEFDVDVRPNAHVGDYRLGEIVRCCQTDVESEGAYTMSLDDLTRHLLIVGLTGGGKTNTAKGLLCALYTKFNIPFLVIESAKREYWELGRLSDEQGRAVFNELNVFTLGDENPETASPFRFNPFEAVPGVSLQTHIDCLLSTFKAAFDLFPPTPYVLETAVYKVYEDRGWDIVTGKNRWGLKRYPMLEDLQIAIEDVTDSLGYNEEVRSNVKAALKARIGSLMIGGKNALMNTPASLDMGYLLTKPTVLELEDLGDDDTKAFVIGMLLARVYEYRRAELARNGVPSGRLEHVIMIEEAHRLLKNVQGGDEGNQSRAKAVEFFCNMLAEIRSFGQGFFIADQSPTKLAPDTLKNTNLKIIHRTVMKEDREAVGGAMNMTEAQINHLSALRVGFAAVFGEGDNRPKLVHFPLMKSSTLISRAQLIARSRRQAMESQSAAFVRGCGQPACTWCEQCCRYGEKMRRFVQSLGDRSAIKERLLQYSVNLTGATLQAFLHTLSVNNVHEARCLSGWLLDLLIVDAAVKRAIFADFVREMSKN